jgi:hypothetical protein
MIDRLSRRAGYVQGRLVGAGHALGLESDMPPEARAVVAQALAEFEERWPDEPKRYWTCGAHATVNAWGDDCPTCEAVA